ncbi:phenoloxidase-activating factor 1 isoform X1 [Diabrotica virgifera virgifera]|uniref:CLIP domain-containing serine protease n=1 Tax=Diabrotica virgifera virgifera TaxID=50390 RepID=A0ABM5KNX9_DIAVI|nr:phenoloxidase-activating factor 1 isoform X1 [Diabrotica virgifera virgifera]
MMNFNTIVFCAFLYCFLNCLVTEAHRGDQCNTPNGETAICTSLYRCPLLLKAMRNQVPSQLKFVSKSQCGYDTVPLVCCGTKVDYSRNQSTTRVPLRRIAQLRRKRGSTCTTPNGELATCASIYDCSHFVKAIRNRIPSQLNFVKKSQCGYDTAPLVCCGSAIEFSTTRNPPSDPVGNSNPVGRVLPAAFTRSSALPDRSTCGFQKSDENENVEGLIYGGVETELKEFPWMALLGYRTRYGTTKWACGGTLISHRYILTAAHCVTGEVSTSVGQLTYVKLGEHDKTKERDCDKNGNCNEKPVITGIERVMFHEKYDATDRTSPNDIAVLRLNQRITYTDFIRPICLPEPNEGSTIDDYLTTAGWGLTEHDATNVKLKVDLPFRTRDDCMTAFRSARLRLTEAQICAGGEDGKDSCKGDSGGPLMKRSNENYLQWYQEGIVSFGNEDCGTAGLPGIYTKVSKFVSWIHSRVKE